jgi:hypothetical protein
MSGTRRKWCQKVALENVELSPGLFRIHVMQMNVGPPVQSKILQLHRRERRMRRLVG